MRGQPSEKVALLGTIDPQTLANTAQLTDAVDMALWEEVLFILLVGDMAASKRYVKGRAVTGGPA